jgi:hypothetical protein
MPCMPDALLFNFCMASRVSLLVLVFPFSHSVCAFGSVLCLVQLFLLLCLFSLSSSSKCLFHFPLLCFLSPIMCPFVSLHRSVSGLYQSFPFLPSYMPVSFAPFLKLHFYCD